MNKKAEIKNRIDLINRGEVPEGYKKVHGYIIPNDWNIVPIKKIARQVKRSVKKPNKSYYRLSVRSHAKGTFHSFVENPETVAMEELFQVKENDLIVNITFAWEHAIAIVKKEDNNLLVSHRFPTYEFNSNASVKFYENIIKLPRIKKMLSDMSPGGAGRNRVLNQTDFYNSLYIPYTNLKEQEKIAKILNCCDKVIKLKQKLLEEKNKEFIIAINKLIYKNNLKYPIKKIEEVCEILDNKRIPLNDEERLNIKGAIPYYGANGVLDFINKYIFDEELVLLAEDGGHFDEYYKRPIAQFVKGKSWINNHAHILKAKNKENLYLYFSLVHKNILSILNGVGRAKLNQADLKKIKIPYPEDKKQNEIARILSIKEKRIKLLEQEIEQYKQLKKSLSQLLLTGIVRTVEVDCEN